MTTPLENIKEVDRGVMLRTVKQIQKATEEQKAQHVKGCMGSLRQDWLDYQARYMAKPTNETKAVNDVFDTTYKVFDLLTLEAVQNVAEMLGKHIESLAPEPSNIDAKLNIIAKDIYQPLEKWEDFLKNLHDSTKFS